MKSLLIALLVLFLYSCNSQQDQQLPKSELVAVVGEKNISVDLLNAYLKANGISNTDEATLKKALNSLVSEAALANIAKKKNIELTREQLNTIEYLKLRSLVNNAKQDHLLSNQITDEEIKKEYNKANSQMGGKEYHIHHLLYKDEVQAIKQREKLATVGDFTLLEFTFKQENPNVRNVGDLGWVTLSQLPKEFANKLSSASDNTVLADVINSQFGAHIVYLEATRNLVPPKLEDVKPGIIKTLQARKLSKFAQLARAKARVEIKK